MPATRVHYYLVHEGGWTVERDERSGEVSFYSPEGEPIPREWAPRDVEDPSLAVYGASRASNPRRSDRHGGSTGRPQH